MDLPVIGAETVERAAEPDWPACGRTGGLLVLDKPR
jgi:hypothetical protein